MNAQMDELNILRRNVYLAERFSEAKDKFNYRGKYLYQMDDGGIGTTISHLNSIQNWYRYSSEEYAFFCEDDLSFETVKYWNFNWEDFISNLPNGWGCVQLCRINTWDSNYTEENIKFRPRYWDDWGSHYIMTRDYAKHVLDSFITEEGVFDLEIKCGEIQPLVENILYLGHGAVYNIPLFVEASNLFPTTFLADYEKSGYQNYDIENKLKNNHAKSRDYILGFWETIGCNITINDLMRV